MFDNLGNFGVVEIPYTEVNSILRFLKKNVQEDDLVLWNGGGNIGDLYQSSEIVRWATFNLLRKFPIVIFPQSVYFQNMNFMNRSIKAYKKDNVTLFLREKKSFEIVDKNFSVKHYLSPDIAFYLEGKLPDKIFSQSRNGVVTLLRDDMERKKHDFSRLYKVLAEMDMDVINSDTYVRGVDVTVKNRKKILYDKLYEISQKELVVTDRLHGMIFAYLTKTPAIVVENNNWKIKSTYDTWLKDVPSIELVDVDDKSINLERKVLRILGEKTEYHNISQNFNGLLNVVKRINE